MSNLRGFGLTAGLILSVLGAFGASAELCSIDEVPAATLLLPFFEVEPGNLDGVTTLFSINNASASAQLAQVTLWTDWAIPTLRFPIYLTGYDVQTINLRDLFRGFVPVTAPDNFDPADSISNQGPLSADFSIPGCTGLGGTLPAAFVDELLRAHRGEDSAAFGGCVGKSWGDGRVRGYITIDQVTTCTELSPADPQYYDGVLGHDNVFWGKVFHLDPENNAAQGESLVAIEACTSEPCPYGDGDQTFYGRYVDFDGSDRREPLPGVFVTSYLNGGNFTGGTELTVWRDTRYAPGGSNGPQSCAADSRPAWWPLAEADVLAFDEAENAVDLCYHGLPGCFPTCPGLGCFQQATQRFPLTDPPPEADELAPPFSFGWLYLNLRQDGFWTTEPPFIPSQAWVSVTMTALDRYSVGIDAGHLDRGCEPGETFDWVLVP
jgi:hypothetical protein